MSDHAQLKHHADLLDRMAETQGIDLQEEAISGRLRFDRIADAVLRCAKCAHPDHCQLWLKAHKDGADRTPDYCRNQDLFELMRNGRGH
ncbi:MAG: hypothetical protein GJ676_13035 [Rhodobacteraceae bacterium]|nr:hypothetical protein [Paracoccaceae bacterium]